MKKMNKENEKTKQDIKDHLKQIKRYEDKEKDIKKKRKRN